MTNEQVAKGLIKQAEARIEAARSALTRQSYPFVVRLSQECVELSLKAALYLMGIDTPKWHDVGEVLRRNRSKFPTWFGKEIDRLAGFSIELRKDREPSMYGDEEAGLPPDELYGQDQAAQALQKAEETFTLCKKLISGLHREEETTSQDVE